MRDDLLYILPASVVALVIGKLLFTVPTKPKWLLAATDKKATQSNAIERARALLPNASLEDDLPLLSCDATALLEKIRNREVTSLRVMQTYIRSAMRSHTLVNSLSEIRFEAALEEAAAIDEEYARTGQLRGPLHGLPCSVKDHFNVKGLDTTNGLSRYCNDPAEDNAAMCQIFVQAGAIIFCKTPMPATGLSFECSSPIWGITRNPYSQSHTCGGSSGGEAALAAMDATVISLGSDIGGSCRIPAGFSGAFGFKPCAVRFPVDGSRSTNPGFEGVRVSLGPLGRSVRDLQLVFKTTVEYAERMGYWQHSNCLPIPWRESALPKKLRFGYYKTDSFLTASPACQRAVQMSVDALTAAGHECTPIELPDFSLGLQLFVAITSADGYKALLGELGDDKPEPFLFLHRLQQKLGPTLMRILSNTVVQWLDPVTASVTRRAGIKPVHELLHAQAQRNEYVFRIRKYVWQELALDGIICPVQAVPAIPIGSSWNLAFLAISTLYWNVVDSSAGVVPVTKVDPAKDAITEAWLQKKPVNTAKILDKAVYGLKGIYQVDEMKGLPLSVQVVGPAYHDEKVLAMMDVLDKALGPREFGPGKYRPPTEWTSLLSKDPAP